MPEEFKFQTAADRTFAHQEAEALSRRYESEVMTLRDIARGARDPKPFEAELEKRSKQATEAHERAAQIASAPLQADLSGMSRGLSDSFGNFAKNAEVLQAGGIGVVGSNTNVDTGEPAESEEEAGEQMTAEELAALGEIPIPDDWETATWNSRRTLAAQFSDRRIKNSDMANDAIRAEIKRRAKAEKDSQAE